jgi:diguanylate cyclase (GGDEF)-like protein
MVAWDKRRSRCVFTALLTLIGIFSGCQRAQKPRALSFDEIFTADSDPARHGQPVVATGVVTYSDPEWHLLMVQDATRGVYFEPPANSDLHAGDQVQITGSITDPSKLLGKAEFTVLKKGQMPAPVQLQNASQFADHPTAFVETVATVHWAEIRNGRATVEAYAGDARLTALIYPGTSESLPRIGSEIRISGVSGVNYDSSGQVQGWRLWTPSSRYIEVLKAGPKDPFTLPVAKLSDLNEQRTGSLVHVSGRVMDRASALSLSDSTKSVDVSLRRPLHGDFVSAEVTGFWTGSAIEDAVIRPTGELLAQRGDIRTISDLKHLSVAEAVARHHVSVRAIVTYFDPNWGLMFVQDKTAAAFVNVSGLNLRLKAGDLVDISGVTGPGDYAPVITDPAVSFVGHGSFPAPVNLDVVQSNLALADSRWCNLRGVVHSVQVVDGHTNLKLGAGETALNVQIPTLINGEPFLDKELSVTGALGILFNERRQAVGHQIFVPAPEFLEVVEGGGQPNPEGTIATLRRYVPNFDEHHSVGFRGTVVLKSAPNSIFVQDETAGIQVRAVTPLDLNVGDRVSVRGFLRSGEYSPALEDAVVIREGPGSPPEPEHISAKSAAEGPHDSEYVSMRGVLAAVRTTPGLVTLVVNEGGTYFDATGPDDRELDSLRVGSEIEVHGICRVALDRTHVPYTIDGFTLAFDSPRSIAIRKLGPWWDARKVRWALVLFGLFAAAAVLWATSLRSKVQTKTQQLQLSLAAKRKAQQFDRARNEILESIARNAPLPESMERLALAIEEQIPDTVCAVLMPADGKSFLNGRPAPVFIAPGLPEEIQHGHALTSALQNTVTADDKHILTADGELINNLLDALRGAGVSFAAGCSTPVFSAAGSVAGILILFSRSKATLSTDFAPQSIVQSASRLILLARDHWQMHTQLLHEARHDGLTGLPNRTVAEDRLEQALARAARRKQSFAVFCIDLDGFKAVNDELGHDAGDDLLRAVAVRLRGRIRHSDTLARMGGDEFLAIIEDCAGDSAARAVADSLIASLKDPMTLEGRQLALSASIGIAMYPADGQNASQLRRNADQAMYRAKSSGGGQGCFWSRDAESSGRAARKSNHP